MALDANSSPASTVGVTDASGNYEMQVARQRDVDGNPLGADVTLRADAAGDSPLGFTAIADRDGVYRIFNLPDGEFSVLGYARGVNYGAGEGTSYILVVESMSLPARRKAPKRSMAIPSSHGSTIAARTVTTFKCSTPLVRRSGMFYQFRVTSFDVNDRPLSRTEDLKGVFFLP